MIIDNCLSAIYNKDMSRPTPTQWVCLNCLAIKTSPYWLAKTRKFCSPRCRAKYDLKQNPNHFKDIGKKADAKKISATLKTKYAAGIINAPMSRLGTVHTAETRAKMTLSHKKRYANGFKGNKGKKLRISEEGLKSKIAATQAMRQRIAKNGKLTDIEQIIDNYLHLNNVAHEHEYTVGRKLMDFYLPIQSIFIEADGAYWHRDKQKDILKDLYVKKLRPDVKIIRCPEVLIKNGTWVKLVPWGAKRGV